MSAVGLAKEDLSAVGLAKEDLSAVGLAKEEPPDAEPQVRWCGSGELITPRDPLRSDSSVQFLAGDITIPEYLSKETPTDGLPTVYRDNGASAVRVSEEVVAALDADKIKSEALERPDDLSTLECGKRAHAMTATR